MERPSVLWPCDVELLFGTSFVEATFANGFEGNIVDEPALPGILRAGLGTDAVEVAYEAGRDRVHVTEVEHHPTMLSESRPDAPWRPGQAMQRNATICRLALGIFVVEPREPHSASAGRSTS